MKSPNMLIDLFIVMTSAVSGFVSGRIFGMVDECPSETNNSKLTSGSAPDQQNSETVTKVAESLKEQTESMAASVDNHQSKMQAVNHSLVESEHTSAEDVRGIVNELMEANRTMQRELKEAQTQIHEKSLELESSERRAHTDALTRVPNRRAFDQFMAKQHEMAPSHTSTMALLDIDHFKKFNDNYGHLAGDEVLRVVAGLLHSRLNQFGMVARYGGEEFAVIFDGTSESEVKQAIEQARIAISQRETEYDNKSLRVTGSIGVAQFNGQETVEEWIKRADTALYQSKESGRNCVHWMNQDDPVLITDSEILEPDAEKADTDKPETEPSESDRSDHDVGSPTEVQDPPASEAVGALDPNEDETEPEADMFADVADQAKLSDTYDELRERIKSDIPTYVMAIRNHDDEEDSMASLLPVVRSRMRAVDKLGYADRSTLLVFMLSVGEETANNRGIEICESALEMGTASGRTSEKPVTIGIAQATSEENFDVIVSRAIDLAQDGLNEENEPVCIEKQTAESA